MPWPSGLGLHQEHQLICWSKRNKEPPVSSLWSYGCHPKMNWVCLEVLRWKDKTLWGLKFSQSHFCFWLCKGNKPLDGFFPSNRHQHFSDQRSHAYEVTIHVCALVFDGFVHGVFLCGCAAAAPNTVNQYTKIFTIKRVGLRITENLVELCRSISCIIKIKTR